MENLLPGMSGSEKTSIVCMSLHARIGINDKCELLVLWWHLIFIQSKHRRGECASFTAGGARGKRPTVSIHLYMWWVRETTIFIRCYGMDRVMAPQICPIEGWGRANEKVFAGGAKRCRLFCNDLYARTGGKTTIQVCVFDGTSLPPNWSSSKKYVRE